jgi:hypothetical protein
MAVTDGTHLQDFSFDKFHSVFLRENTRLHHAVVFLHAEESSNNFGLHVGKHIVMCTVTSNLAAALE